MIDKLDICTGLVLGAIIGGTFMGIHAIDSGATLKEYNRTNKPKVIRMYNAAREDAIFVEDSSNNYLELDAYLEKYVSDKYDRDIEKAEIEKLVDWEDLQKR